MSELDAARFRWLKRYLHIASDGPGEWTCWLSLDQMPFRFDPRADDPVALLDALIERFPLAPPSPTAGPDDGQSGRGG